MSNLIFLVGLPGAGKTTLAKTQYQNYKLIDDPVTAPEINLNEKTIIADCHLCDRRTFKQVCELYPQSLFILFENNLEQCYKNVLARNDGRKITYEYMVNLSGKYAKILKAMWNINYKEHKVYGT